MKLALRSLLISFSLLSACSFGMPGSNAAEIDEPTIPMCGAKVADALFPLPFIGKDPKIELVRRQIALIAPEDVSVLILGESGTGKEVVARAIQASSKRSDKPYIARNIAAIPKELAESELFGHAKGAFTGAATKKEGIFKQADGGTVFLDEIGEMELPLQVKLLRVLENKQIDVVGGPTEEVNFRLIAATNAGLDTMVKEKKFRIDLYYRLNVIELRLPALRERDKWDILLLAEHFCKTEAAKRGNEYPVKKLSPKAQALLMAYPWPGNIRELQNIIMSAYIYAQTDPEITEFHLPQRILASATTSSPIAVWPEAQEAEVSEPPLSRPLSDVVEEVEKRYLLAVLKQTKGNQSQAADILKISRSTLRQKLRRWGIVENDPTFSDPKAADQ